MKEYKKIRINLSFWHKTPDQDYIEIANRESKDGWKLLQIFAPNIGGYGLANYFDLVFERDC